MSISVSIATCQNVPFRVNRINSLQVRSERGLALWMTRKDPSGPLIVAAFELDTTSGPHPCLSCRQFGYRDLAPGCAIDYCWFMLKRPNWSCSGFEREPGDQ